ncbi:MAG: hypothetical protein MJE77_06755 [Proteobacteria bacterium]|nr:hypothetical protein [Pseudomonadota bacterium]
MTNEMHIYSATLLVSALILAVASTACGRGGPSPVIVGKVEATSLYKALLAADPGLEKRAVNLHTDLDVRINGDAERVSLDEDLTFAVPSLPTGDVTFEIDVASFTGSITVHQVQLGELIDVEVYAEDSYLEIRVVRRLQPEPDLPPPDQQGVIEINGNEVVYHLDPGLYDGDIVINGNRVTLVGPINCEAILYGDLIVNGNDIRVINVDLRGQTYIRGNDIDVYHECEGYADSDSDSD